MSSRCRLGHAVAFTTVMTAPRGVSPSDLLLGKDHPAHEGV
jgi:hypothetical protein